MAKVTLVDPTTNFQSTTQVESNNTLLETAIENTLSRDGTTPNMMNASLDMNGNSIINASNATITASDLGNTQFATTAAELKAYLEASGTGGVIVSTGLTLTESITGHANKVLIVYPGGLFSGAFTLTINGGLDVSPRQQIFDTDITISFGAGAVAEVYPYWWGCVADDSTICDTGINSAIDALPSVGGTVKILHGTHKLTSKITISKQGVTIEGQGAETSILKQYSEVDGIFADSTVARYGTRIKGLQILDAFGAGRTAGHGINLDGSASDIRFHIEDVYVLAFYDNIHIVDPGYSTIQGWVRVTSAARDGIHIDGTGGGGVNVYLENTHALTSTRYNYYFEEINFLTLDSTMSDSATSHGYYFLNTNNVTLNSTTSEDNGNDTGHGYFISGGDNYTFNSTSASKALTVDGYHFEGTRYVTMNSPSVSTTDRYGISFESRTSPARTALYLSVNNPLFTSVGTGFIYDPLGEVVWNQGKRERIGLTGIYNPEIDLTTAGNIDAGEDTLVTMAIPALTFAPDDRIMTIIASGTTGANGNNKTIVLKFAGTTLGTSGAVALNAKSWVFKAEIARGSSSAVTVTTTFSSSDSSTAPTETTHAAITGLDLGANSYDIVVTGEGTATDDVVFKRLIVGFG